MMLSAIINLIWLKQLDFQAILKYEKVFEKAFHDIEALYLAGFLKLAFIQEATALIVAPIDGINRKIRSSFNQCTVKVIVRNLATMEDINSFFDLSNQIEEKSKVKNIIVIY